MTTNFQKIIHPEAKKNTCIFQAIANALPLTYFESVQLLKLSNAAAIKGKALQRKLVNLLDTMQYEAADAVNANGIIAWDLCFKATRHTAIDFLERSKTK